MRTLKLLCFVAAVIILVFAGASRGDGEPDATSDQLDDFTEPITGEAVAPNPGSEEPMRDPFTPYDIGGPAAAWRLEDLSAEEQVVAVRGLDEDQSAVQQAYAEIARGMAERAKAASATNELRIAPLGELGVVP